MWEALKAAARWVFSVVLALLLVVTIGLVLFVFAYGDFVDPECERRCAPNGGLLEKETVYNPFGADYYVCRCEDGVAHRVFPWTWLTERLTDALD